MLMVLVIITASNTKINKVENEIPGSSDLVKKTDYYAEISAMENF